MKRTTLLIITALMAVCARAQYISTMAAGDKDYIMGIEHYFVTYNFEDVCQSLGAKPEEFGHILEVWLDPYRAQNWPNEYSRYESQKYVYLKSGSSVVGKEHRLFNLTSDGGVAQRDEEHWTCTVFLEKNRNRLSFDFAPVWDMSTNYGPNGSPTLKTKAGNRYHYTFGLEYQGKQATFDIIINMVEDYGGNAIPLAAFEKVGEQEVKMKYVPGKTSFKAKLDTEEIAKAFGGHVKGGNLDLYVTKKNDRQTLTDRYAYQMEGDVLLDERLGENFNSRAPRALILMYYPKYGDFGLYPTYENNFEKGEHVTGPVYLVADGKCYELKLDLQIGEPNQHTRNLAVLKAAEQCGTFARSLTVSPESIDDMHAEARASFSLPTLAKALGADCKKLTEALKYWQKGNETEDGSEMVYNLTDYASTVYSPRGGPGSFTMTKGGKAVRSGGDYTWLMEVDGQMNELQYTLWQEGGLKDGDVCNTKLGLYYGGRMVTLDLTLNIKQGRQGTQVALSSMKKVGEQTITGKCTSMSRRVETPLPLDSIAALFSNGVAGKGLKLYVMENAEKGMLTDRYAYEKEPEVYLKLEGTPQNYYKSQEYFCVTYWPYHELMFIDGNTDALRGGQKTSASLFLVSEDEYYELVLDIQFGEETDERDAFDIVATEHLDVQLMPTDSYYTYYDKESGSHALVSTPIDEDRLAELLGTETPMLFAEQTELDGSITMTSRYSCAPGQGFWFALHDGLGSRTIHGNAEGWLGVYYTDGSFKWYEEPYPPLQVGKKYTINLYMANLMRGTAVKYEIEVETVKEIETPSIAYVHRLPADLTRNANGVEAIHNAQCIIHNGTNAIYNLQGRKINLPQPLQRRGTQGLMPKGVYIVNGKKVLIK